MTTPSGQELARLINRVTVKLTSVAKPGANSGYHEWTLWHREGERVCQELRDECGARIRLDREPATMSLGGIKSSATGGWSALLNNWRHAARKRMLGI